jgi:uncharacterized protein
MSGTTLRIAALLAGAAVVTLLHSPSQAAALECAKPKGPYAKAICADPALRQQDRDLTAGYDRLAADASSAGKTLVQRDAQGRRAYIEERCAPSDIACLAAAYHQAIGSLLKFQAQPAGGILLPVERFKLGKSSLVTAYPRLDSPAERWADAFEKAARDAVDALKPDDAETDAVIGYHATYLAPDIAAVAFSVWTYRHGAEHGKGYQVAFNYLPAEQRRLRATDLFESGTTWSGFLAERAFDGLQQQAKVGNWELTAAGPGNLEKAIADPANWLIHPDGLWLYFAPGTVGPDEQEVLVPWADLKPYLRATPAFEIPVQ